MFYCQPCSERRNWPESIRTSVGPCEMCGVTTTCFDVNTRFLPPCEPAGTFDEEDEPVADVQRAWDAGEPFTTERPDQ